MGSENGHQELNLCACNWMWVCVVCRLPGLLYSTLSNGNIYERKKRSTRSSDRSKRGKKV